MAYCNQCGKELDEGDSFCHSCGATAVKPGQAAAPAPPQAGVQPPSPPVPPTAYGAALAGPPVPPGQEVAETPEEIAERKVKKRMELWTHLGSYVIVNAFLVILWAITGAGYPWFIWVMVGWGIGVAFHIMEYIVTSYSDPRRQDMIRKEMERMQRKQGAGEEPRPPGEKQE